MAALTLERAGETAADLRDLASERYVRLRTRLVGVQPADRLLGWLGPLVVAAIGGVLRFWNLGTPHQLVFDETYYVKEGWSMIQYGVEVRNDPTLDAAKQIDQNFTAGHWRTVYDATNGDLVVHPPVGKWVIGLGEWLFGITNSFGWRFSVALLGTLSILMVGRAARRMFGSSLLGTVAAILLAFDGHHFVHSRTGLLDLVVMFFAFAGFCFLLIDRDHSREVLARRVAALPRGGMTRMGPSLGWRPWRWAAGVMLGLSTATKWSGLYFVVAFGLMTVLWDLGARRAAGVPGWRWAWLVRDAPYALAQVVGTTVVVYVASWTGWFRSTQGYNRQWADTHPSAHFGWVPGPLRSLWDYHRQMFDFSINLHSPHPYMSNPWSWMLQGRPTSFFYEGPTKGQDGCTVAICSKAITSIGTVSVWWGGLIAILVLLFMWALRRDWRAGAILGGLAGGWLPWFLYQDRTIFTFYAVAFVPYVVLACTYVLGLCLGGPSATRSRRQVGLLVTGLFCALTVGLFAFFYPIYVAQVVPQDFWRAHMWFPSWV